MSESMFDRIRDEGMGPLSPSKVKLKTYTGEIVSPEGVGMVKVRYGQQDCRLPVTVVKGNVPALLGRDWLHHLKLSWHELFPVRGAVHQLELGGDARVRQIVDECPEVFTDKLGCLKGFKVEIPVESGVKPKFFKARPVPYALRTRVEAELDRLEEQGVWKRVQYSKWAAPTVVTLKDPSDPSGPIRICGDYKITINQTAPLDAYPIPKTEDQLATLTGGEKFTKLDLSQAYQQLELDEASRELLMINMHQGLYQPFRLQFGVHSATGIFQREMDKRLSRIPFVKVRVNDILISGKNDKEHLGNLRTVVKILKESGLTVKQSKCSFMQDEVEYCGYIVNKEGVRPVAGKIEAIQKAPAPTNITELRSFLGMATYYVSYLPNMATVTEPLHQLLRKGVKWEWDSRCAAAFKEVKEMLCSAIC